MFRVHEMRWKSWVAGIGFVSLILPAGAGKAQEVPGLPSYEVGLRFGAGGSVVRFQDPSANDQTEVRTAFHLGIGASRALGRFFEVEGSVLLSQGGFGGRGGHPTDLGTGHLELPIVLRARLPWKISPHLVGGVSPRVLLICRLSDVGQVGETGCKDPVVGTDWRGFDLAWLWGMGMSFGLGPGTGLLEGLIQWGIRDIKAGPLPPGWAKSADLRLSASFRLPMGGEK
jgi:hypothetical protein